MATKAYVGVSDKARQVRRMYIGVDGKARRVKKAYIGVNGVARLFFVDGVEWKKYQCTVSTETYEEEYTYYEKNDVMESGNAHPLSDDNGNVGGIGGYANYSFNSEKGIFTLTGSMTELPKNGMGGRVYSGGGDSVDYDYVYSGDGKWWYKSGTIYAVKKTGYRDKTRTTYTVGNSLGTVYADEGARPDSDKGYTYVTTNNGYTIMKSGSTYYAYKQA